MDFLGNEQRANPGRTNPCDRISRAHVVRGILRHAAYGRFFCFVFFSWFFNFRHQAARSTWRVTN